MSATAEHARRPDGRETLTAFRAPDDLLSALKAERERTGKSASEIIRRAVRAYLTAPIRMD